MLDWNFIAGLIATVAFDIIYFGAIIGTITVIILDNRNPVKTMAWILVLMFLPVVGLVFYFFFGRSQRRVRVIGKKSYNRLLKNILPRIPVRFRQITDALSLCFATPTRLFLSMETVWKSIRGDFP